MQAIMVQERAAGADGLALAEVTYPHASGHVDITRADLPGRAREPTGAVVAVRRNRLNMRSGERILKSPGDIS
jgi:hypothetical protein